MKHKFVLVLFVVALVLGIFTNPSGPPSRKDTGAVAADAPLTVQNEGASSLLETHFNVTGSTSTNITIASNETVQLANTAGYYLGLYSFRNDANGADPVGWTVTEAANTHCTVIATLGGHNKIVDLNDTSASSYPAIYNTFTATTTGTTEFYFQSTDTTKGVIIQFYNGGGNVIIYLSIPGLTASKFAYYDGAFKDIAAAANNIWYHLKIDWNATGWQIKIDNTQYGTGYSYAFQNAIGAGITKLYIRSGGSATAFHYYFDAIDYSWDTGYVTNRNQALEYNKTGVYTSPIYDLTQAAFYQTLTFNTALGISGTALTLQYRDSKNGITWNSWCPGLTANLTIDAFKNRYFQFRINLSSTWSSANHYQYTAWCYWVNFTYTTSAEADIICELQFLLTLLQGNISTLQQANTQLQQNINRLQANITVLFAAIAQFQSNLTVLQQINLDLQYQLLLLQGNLTTLIQINFAFQMTILQLEANITQLLTINLQLQGNLTVLWQINLDLQGVNLQLTASILYFQSMNTLLLGNITQLQLTIVQLQAVIADLQFQTGSLNSLPVQILIWSLVTCAIIVGVLCGALYVSRRVKRPTAPKPRKTSPPVPTRLAPRLSDQEIRDRLKRRQ